MKTSRVDRQTPQLGHPRFGLGLVTYAVSIGLAFVSAWLVVAIYAATAIYYAFNQIPWLADEGT
jgi:hypothetical protein